MGGLRRWVRRLEHSSREMAGTIILMDEETGAEFEVPKGAFFLVLDAAVGEAPDPTIEAILPTEDDPDRLQRLYYTNGEPFWLYPTRLANTEG